MKKRKIKDIRLFNETKYQYIENLEVNIFIARLVLKLREQNFSLSDDFDHLYILFTRKIKEGEIKRKNDEIDIYHKWFRYCLFGINDNDYQELNQKSVDWFLEKIEIILLHSFTHTLEEQILIKTTINEIKKQKENYQVIFKEKIGRYNIARIYLKVDVNGSYLPILKVTTKDGTILLNKELPITKDFCEFGKIKLLKEKIIIYPKENSYSQYRNLKPVTFYLYK